MRARLRSGTASASRRGRHETVAGHDRHQLGAVRWSAGIDDAGNVAEVLRADVGNEHDECTCGFEVWIAEAVHRAFGRVHPVSWAQRADLRSSRAELLSESRVGGYLRCASGESVPVEGQIRRLMRQADKLTDYTRGKPVTEIDNAKVCLYTYGLGYRPYTRSRAALEQLKSSGGLEEMRNLNDAQLPEAREYFDRFAESDREDGYFSGGNGEIPGVGPVSAKCLAPRGGQLGTRLVAARAASRGCNRTSRELYPQGGVRLSLGPEIPGLQHCRVGMTGGRPRLSHPPITPEDSACSQPTSHRGRSGCCLERYDDEHVRLPRTPADNSAADPGGTTAAGRATTEIAEALIAAPVFDRSLEA